MRAVLLGLSLNQSFAVRTSHYADEDTMTWRRVVPNQASGGMCGDLREHLLLCIILTGLLLVCA